MKVDSLAMSYYPFASSHTATIFVGQVVNLQAALITPRVMPGLFAACRHVGQAGSLARRLVTAAVLMHVRRLAD
jgi:hypothetical protein